ncbi:MAG: hypothetical protein AAFN27_00440 [Pseudomonadota bacterium]
MSDISTKNAALETMAAEYNSATQWFVKLRRKRLPPLSIRLTETERAELKAAADGQSLNSYIKDQLFGASGKVALSSPSRPASPLSGS